MSSAYHLRSARPIAKLIASSIRRDFLICIIPQTLLISALLGYLSYKEARERAVFLASSSEQSLGLMIAVGDYFQLRNVLHSFRSDLTPFLWVLDSDGRDVLHISHPSILRFDRVFSTRLDLQLYSGQIMLLSQHPLIYKGEKWGVLVLANRLRLDNWIIFTFALFLSFLLTMVLQSRRLGRLSSELGDAIADLGHLFHRAETEDSIEQRLAARAGRAFQEIEDLSLSIGKMLIERVKQAGWEKEAAVGRLMTNISHDMRPLLGTFERFISLPDRELPSMKVPFRESLHRLYALVESLRRADLELMVRVKCQKALFDIPSEPLRLLAASKKIELLLPSHAVENLWIDAAKFERAWMNLLTNAIEAAKSRVILSYEIRGADLYLRVCDDGAGIPDEVRPRLFERGITAGKPGGTGLGLAYVQEVMRGHGGSVKAIREGDLTIFECHLPSAVYRCKAGRASFPLPPPAESRTLVALCLEPADLNAKLGEALSSLSSHFSYQEQAKEAAIVMTNQSDLAVLCLEEGQRVIEFALSTPFDEILRRARNGLGLKVKTEVSKDA